MLNKTTSWKNKNKERVYQNNKKWREANIESVRENAKTYRENNKEHRKDARKQWQDSNPGYLRNYIKNRMKTDISFKISRALRSRLFAALKNNCKTGSAVRDLGCSIEELKLYLESKWQSGMTWDNYKYTGWHIDHVVPLCAFDLTDKEQLLKACHYTNLQSLWASENLKKSGTYVVSAR